MIKIVNDEEFTIMRDRLKMLEEDIRSTILNKKKKKEAPHIPQVDYEEIVEENIELKHNLNSIQ